MKILKEKYMKIISKFSRLLFITFLITFSFNLFSKEIIIKGNKFSDQEAIFSIIGDIPEADDKSKSNYILKQLNNSGLFKIVEVSYDDNSFYIDVKEYPSLNNVFYSKNERLKNEELDEVIKELEIYTLSKYNIDRLVNELTKIYQSFGYNSAQIETKFKVLENNSADLYLDFNEGEITKIKKIVFTGNNNIDSNVLLSKIKSKTKNITNLFANNNFKLFEIKNDLLRIKRFYKSQGYRDIDTDFYIEYYPDNKVEINFQIIEGEKYYFSTLKINNNLKEDSNIQIKLDDLILKNDKLINQFYNRNKLDDIEQEISKTLESFGVQFFQIKVLEKTTNNSVDILFDILRTKTTYIKNINISGNKRTYDYVIRREIDIAEGDPINDTKIKQIKRDLNRLPIFSKVEINKSQIIGEYQDLEIDVEETQTGTFNVGVSVGTFEGISFLSGLKERNINGTGRSLEFLINTSDNNRAFTLSTTDKFVLNNKVDHQYSTRYKENDFSKSKSYKLNELAIDTSFKYLLSENLYHTLGLGYSLKDYIVTKSSTVSSNIRSSAGQNISFNINNQLTLNTLNSFIRPTNGVFISLTNFVETPSSSSNGFIKNTLSARKYIQSSDNIYSAQAKLGNIASLNNNEILSDNKFSLGGRWLRGFDNFGAGPRNSRTAYVGGNNLLVTKFDFSRPITLNDQNPIYLNLFNDYGLVWSNKNNVTFSDESIRASYGFGFNYYSPIGPIGFTWGFPIVDKDYDIKRMFMFTIGNLN